MQLSVHSEPEKYLENIYGDFMRLPKEEDRVGHFEAAYGKQEVKMSKVNIMGIDIDSLTNQETIDRVEEFIINKKTIYT